MARKTVEVQGLKELTNRHLALRDDKVSTPASRQAVSSILEAVLHQTDNYKGFKYRLSEWDVEAQELREGYDDTRREYY
jgi:hypothetical protein